MKEKYGRRTGKKEGVRFWTVYREFLGKTEENSKSLIVDYFFLTFSLKKGPERWVIFASTRRFTQKAIDLHHMWTTLENSMTDGRSRY
jgi:hypothetical protein